MLNSGKKIATKRINILTLVLSKKIFLNEKKTIAPCKLNGRSLIELFRQCGIFFIHFIR
jgi:hypothetical protein